MGKKKVIILVGILSIFLIVWMIQAGSQEWIIDGDKVYFENQYGRIEVSTHTSKNIIHQEQFLNITWFKTQENLDFAFELSPEENEKWKNKKISIWSNYSHPNEQPIYGNVTKSGFCESSEYGLINPTRGWCNESLINGTNYWEADLEWYSVAGDNATFYWNETEIIDYTDKFYYDFKDISSEFSSMQYNGNYYYFIQNVNFDQDESKFAKIEYDVPINSNGKWNLFVKKSSDSLADALSSGYYIKLDPWWDSNWNKKQEIVITENYEKEDLLNYTMNILVNYDSDMQADFDDIRFLNASETGELGFYLINKTDSNVSNFAVYLPNITNATTTSIYMYYDNAGATSDSNRSSAYMYFDDFLDDHKAQGWDSESTYIMGNGWLNQTGGTTYQDWGTGSYWNTTIDYGFEAISSYHVTDLATQIRPSGDFRNADARTANIWSGGYVQGTFEGRQNCLPAYDGNCTSSSVVSNGGNYTDKVILFLNDVGEGTWEAYTDDVLQKSFSGSSTAENKNSLTSFQWVSSAERGEYEIDWVQVRGYVSPEPTATFGAEQSNDASAPELEITSPPNNTNSSNTGLEINYTVSDPNLEACWYSNDSMTLNLTLTNCANITGITWSEGQHNVTIWSNDTSNRENSTSLTFTIDTINPELEITSPPNNTITSNTGLEINYTASDLNLVNCWYTNDTYDGNITLANCANITSVTWIEGQHNVTIWANDSAGNENSSSVQFTIDTIAPTWENNKTNMTNLTLSGESVYFNITVNDSNPDSYIFAWYNGTDWENETASYTDGEEINVEKTINLNSGNINWTWYFNDSLNNINQTDVWNITLIETAVLNGTFGEVEWERDSVNLLNSTIGETLLFNNTDSSPQEIRLSNLTNSLIFFNNNTLIGSGNLLDNNESINISIPSGNWTYVLNRFNLTEGSIRQNSPLWINSKTDDGKTVTYHLASNLTDAINTTFYPIQTIPCSSTITFTPKDGTSFTPITTCINNFISEVTLTSYNPSNSSNTLTITYSTTQSTGGGSSIQRSSSQTINESIIGNEPDSIYNLSLMCQEVEKFLFNFPNYTSDEYNIFKNDLEIIQGMSIADSLLTFFIEDFEINCPKYVEPTITDKFEDSDYKTEIIIVLTFILLFIVLLVLNRVKKV